MCNCIAILSTRSIRNSFGTNTTTARTQHSTDITPPGTHTLETLETVSTEAIDGHGADEHEAIDGVPFFVLFLLA